MAGWGWQLASKMRGRNDWLAALLSVVIYLRGQKK